MIRLPSFDPPPRLAVLRITVIVVALMVNAVQAREGDLAPLVDKEENESTSLESMGPTLSFSDNPVSFNVNSFGPMTLSFVGSGFYQWQSNAVDGDHTGIGDMFNGHVLLQKSTGEWQFLLHAGVYSFPTLGAPYFRAGKTLQEYFGPLPEAYVKWVPNDQFSIMAGKIPTLGGVENGFTYQNLNIQRGLLWNLTSTVARGAQANYSTGPFGFSLAWTDGYYSNRYTWASGSASVELDDANSLMVIAGANLKPSAVSTIVAPIFENNSQVYNLIYTYSSGPWYVSPYLQMTRVPASPQYGLAVSGQTLGAAVLASYSFPKTNRLDELSLAGFSLPFRAEYLTARADEVDGAPNPLLGPKSRAWSLTITPTLQRGPFFIRAEYAYVRAPRISDGFGFGPEGDRRNQSRVSLEAGFIY
jgi:hypothetical protein